MSMMTWSTDAVAPRERFDYWREAVCKSVFEVTTEAGSDNFTGRLNGRGFGNVRVMSFDCSGHELVRNRKMAENSPADYYVVTLHQRGRSYFSQGHETLPLRPNEIAIVDGRLPFRVNFSDAVSRASAIIPQAMLLDRAPWLRTQPCRKIAPRSDFADLARRHLRLLTAEGGNLKDNQALLLTENLCNLLALATRDAPVSRMEPVLMRDAVFQYCRQNLHNMDLSPKLVAARFGISVRTLHLRFQEAGDSFGRWVLQNRLEATKKALGDPQQRDASIAEIAYGAGFGDLSYFNRSFRARFSMSPGQWRSGCGRPQA
jgi:AraC-like DNA-binding protein